MSPKVRWKTALLFGSAVILSGVMWMRGVATEGTLMPTKEAQGGIVKEADEVSCWPLDRPLPENARLLAAGAYAGRELEFQIDSSGHRATQIDVVVNITDAPVVLMLGAYEPTVWAISWTEGSRLAGILVSGNHRQVVAGLPDAIPVIESTQENRYRCGSFYVAEDHLHELNPVARQVFGRPVEMVYLAKEGRVVVGADLPPDAVLLHGATIDPDALRLPGTPLAGAAGLAEAERLGLLRKATIKDAQGWVEAYRRHQPKIDAPPVSGETTEKPLHPTLHNAYVVLREFTYPAGLYGGNMATFYVPLGVPAPKGNPGHSTVFDIATGTCQGAMCKAL